jgi:dipeptidyl-peptidase-3
VKRLSILFALIGITACGGGYPPDLVVAPNAPASATAPTSTSGGASVAPPAADDFKVLMESFGDNHILRYRVPGFEQLAPKQKEMLYYLYEAALSGRDIIYDQKYRYNLLVRRTLDAVVESYRGDRAGDGYKNLLLYAKQVWFSRGIHHDYSSDKYQPAFSKEQFAALVKQSDAKLLPLEAPPGASKARSVDELIAFLTPILFDPEVAPKRVDRSKGRDVVKASSNNFYEGVSQKEVEAFYKKMADPKDTRPPSWGLNSKLVKENGKLVEKVWKVGGMYSPAIEKIVYWLEKAASVAENDKQKAALDKLVAYYKSGDLKTFDEYNIAWVKDTDSRIDVVNGFIETYGDALGYRATFESVVSMRDLDRSKRIATIGGAAQWFEDHSPIADKHKKKKVVGISAKVITVVVEGGDAAPTTPIGINLPNSAWIRKEHGSKSVFLGNIVDAYQQVLKDSGVLEEFSASDEERARGKQHGSLGYALKVDMHEVIGHASGQLDPGVGTPKQTLKNYASALEEARADLVALYYVMDPKLIELGVMKSLDVGKAAYDGYVRNGLLVQLARIKSGNDIVQSHMRNRQMVCRWAYEKGKKDKVIERVDKDGKIYFVIRDYPALRKLWGQLLREVQRIKSEGDFEAGKALIEDYGVKVDRAVHENVLGRYQKLGVKPYSGFIQPKLTPVMKGGVIVDVTIEYPTDFTRQMLDHGKRYQLLPTYN